MEVVNSLVNIPFSKGLSKDIIETEITSDNIHYVIEHHKSINFKNSFQLLMKELDIMFHNEEVCGEEIIFIIKELMFIILHYQSELKSLKPKLDAKYTELKLMIEKNIL